MIRVSALQISAFAEYSEAHFAKRIATSLQNQFRDASLSPHDELVAEVRRLIPLARSYGLDSEQQFACFAVTAWIFGTNFHFSMEWARNILKAELPAFQKAESLQQKALSVILEVEEISSGGIE